VTVTATYTPHSATVRTEDLGWLAAAGAAGLDVPSTVSVRLPSMSTRSIAAWHCGEQQRSERAGCGPCPCRRSTRRSSARAERLDRFIGRVHRSFADAYWPFTDGEYCPFVGGGIDSG
jgi:hypothetical protein